MSGGEPLVARDLYKSEIEFKPEFVIWFATNPLPNINDASHSIWRRIWLIPFNQKISAEKKIRDYEKKLIESEGSGIFNWMIEGLRRYYEEGHLIKPKAIEEATKDYKDDEDPIGEYLADRCVIDPDGRIPSAEIYSDYLNFCLMKEKNYPVSKKNFGTSLMDHGFTPYRNTFERGYEGVRLVTGSDMMNREKERKKSQRRSRKYDKGRNIQY